MGFRDSQGRSVRRFCLHAVPPHAHPPAVFHTHQLCIPSKLPASTIHHPASGPPLPSIIHHPGPVHVGAPSFKHYSLPTLKSAFTCKRQHALVLNATLHFVSLPRKRCAPGWDLGKPARDDSTVIHYTEYLRTFDKAWEKGRVRWPRQS